VYADDGKIRHFVEFKKDITEIKQAQLRQQRRLEELEAQRMINQAIAGIFGLQITLEIICAQALNLFPADAVGILLYSPPNQTLSYAAGDGFRLEAYQDSQCQLDEDFAGKVATSRKTIRIDDLNQDPTSFEVPSTVNQEGFRCYTGIPLIAKGELKGVMEIFHRKAFIHDEHWLNLVESMTFQIAVAIDDEHLYAKLRHQNVNLFKAYNATIEGWSRALELRDRETEGHTLRVADVTLLLAKQMGIRDEELIQIRRGALLHDIGKIGVPDSILLKPGKLTDAEWEIMKKHPEVAFKLLSPIEYLRSAVDIPFCHHEKWDGSGYPRGLKGHQIPLSARIFAVIDVWDALRSDRPYRKAWPEDRVMDYIKSQSGTHFDPDVVDVFFEVQEEIQTMAA
jgi:putative nucleotidyltransferase with HDIG domain